MMGMKGLFAWMTGSPLLFAVPAASAPTDTFATRIFGPWLENAATPACFLPNGDNLTLDLAVHAGDQVLGTLMIGDDVIGDRAGTGEAGQQFLLSRREANHCARS